MTDWRRYILDTVVHVVVDWVWAFLVDARILSNGASAGRLVVDCGISDEISWSSAAVSLEGVQKREPLGNISPCSAEGSGTTHMSNFVGDGPSKVVAVCGSAWDGIVTVGGTVEL